MKLDVLTENISIELCSGTQAALLFHDADFLASWNELHQSCSWATCYQHPTFVLTWHRIYQARFTPIVIIARRNGRLVGLFTLAKEEGTSLITGAGWKRAEYQAWLAEPELNDDFIRTALTLLQKTYKKHVLHLQHLPAGIPLNWLKANGKHRFKHVLRVYQRPLIHIQADHFEQKLKSKTIKEKMRRLQRLGNLRLEKVTDYNVLADIIEELALQSDFRKGAAYNYLPSQADPHLKKLLLALFKEGLAHVTLLKLNDEIIAATVNTVDRNWMYLQGLNTHSPFYSKHSPGLIHFLLLGRLLAEENIAIFDLTPGGDYYKEVLATQHDEVYELWITDSLPAHIRIWSDQFIKRQIRENLEHQKIDPRVFRSKSLKVMNSIRLVSQRGLFSVLRESVIHRASREKFKLLRLALTENQMDFEGQIKRNALQDMLQYDERRSPVTQWQFLENAMRQYSFGEKSFTYSENGILQACIWLSEKKNPDTKRYPVSPEGSLVLHQSYCHRSFNKHFAAFVLWVAKELAMQQNNPDIFLAASTHETACFKDLDKLKVPEDMKGLVLL